MLYTVCASLPFLIIIIIYFNSLNQSVSYFPFFSTSAIYSLTSIMVIIGFLVKIPMFFFHLWLPKAHVEAPVTGSIILAAVLLKLGGFGLFRFNFMIFSSTFLINFVYPLSIIGGAVIRILCIRQRDLKVLIAYSSVAHIRFVIRRIIVNSALGLWAALRIIIAHAFSSSGLFLGANYIYLRSSTRIIFLNKCVIRILPLFSMYWFMLCVASIGGPPTFNLLREIVNISLIFNWEKLRALFLFIIAGFAVAYRLLLFSLTQHSNSSVLGKEVSPLSALEHRNLFAHSFIVVLIVFLISSII